MQKVRLSVIFMPHAKYNICGGGNMKNKFHNPKDKHAFEKDLLVIFVKKRRGI